MTDLNHSSIPRHVAIIMDGNGRWAKKRFLPRIAGHKAGVDAVHRAVQFCVDNHIEALTIFAFSSENWRRPFQEVSYLMGLFITVLERETKKLHEKNIRFRIIGDRSHFDVKLQECMSNAEKMMENNTGLKLTVAANYGGQWDICHAVTSIAEDIKNNRLEVKDISAKLIESRLATAGIDHPDLLIRTSGEQRISNFMLWQLAYSELYFTDLLWPDFDEKEFNKAIAFYANRERRFGFISEQIRADSDA